MFDHYPVAVQSTISDANFEVVDENNLIGNTPDYCLVQPKFSGYGTGHALIYCDLGQSVVFSPGDLIECYFRLHVNFPDSVCNLLWYIVSLGYSTSYGADPTVLTYEQACDFSYSGAGDDNVWRWISGTTFHPMSDVNSGWLRLLVNTHYLATCWPVNPPPASIDGHYGSADLAIAHAQSSTTPPLNPVFPPSGEGRMWVYKSVDGGRTWTSRGIQTP